jgi:glyoxylase-like metal-dependent hydrolase (beta-lactamase superfamily II)
MRPPIRRALWSVPLVAVLLGGIGLAWLSLRTDGYPVRGIDLRAEIDGTAWTLYAIEYARSRDVASDRLVRGGEGHVDMSWYFWLALGHGRALLVDTGTDRFANAPEGGTAERWSVRRSRSVPDALAAAGIAPEEITDVILTHHHWDHVEGLEHFGAARVFAHSLEWLLVEPTALRVEDFTTTPMQPLPGVTVVEAGRHTRHHCVVEIECGDGPVVIGGDGAYLFHNLEAGVPISVTRSDELNVADMQALVERVGEGRVLPGHDPAVFERFDSPREGIARICP